MKTTKNGYWFRVIQCQSSRLLWLKDRKIDRLIIVLAYQLQSGRSGQICIFH